MSEREELAALLADLADADVSILLATARRLRVTMAPNGESLDDERRAWERAAVHDAATRLQAIEADLPPGEVDAWLDALREGATPYRFNPATGELEEVKA